MSSWHGRHESGLAEPETLGQHSSEVSRAGEVGGTIHDGDDQPENSHSSSAEEINVRLKVLRDVLDAETVTNSEASKVADYIARHIPEIYRHPLVMMRAHALIARGLCGFREMVGDLKISGREYIPVTGPVLIVANHTRTDDQDKLRGMTSRSVYVVGADLHFQGNEGRNDWVMQRSGIIPVKASLKNLPLSERQALLERLPSKGLKAYYQAVMQRDDAGPVMNRDFVRTVVALLARGEAVSLFPEGLWLYEGNTLRRAYGGVEYIASEFKKLTGKDLPILPVGLTTHEIHVGEPVALNAQGDVHDIMRLIAQLLPESDRGYYADQQV